MKLKHLYMLGVVALMTASCNEDRFLDLKPQGSLNEIGRASCRERVSSPV